MPGIIVQAVGEQKLTYFSRVNGGVRLPGVRLGAVASPSDSETPQRVPTFAFDFHYFVDVVRVFVAAFPCMHMHAVFVVEDEAATNMWAFKFCLHLGLFRRDFRGRPLMLDVHALCFRDGYDHIRIGTRACRYR